MKRAPRPAGLLVAAALVSASPVLAVVAATAAPAAVTAAAVAHPAAAPTTDSNISWD